MEDLRAGRYDRREAAYKQLSPGIYECVVRLENAAEKYLHYAMPLILRLVPLQSPVVDELQEELYREGFTVPTLLEHVVETEPEDEPLALGRQP
jgi:hypothetical protein